MPVIACGSDTISQVDPRLLKGEVKYNGLSAAELKARGIHLSQLVQYIPQLDEHSPFLTVRETLQFIASNALAGVDAEGAEARVQEMLALLRLQDCANTVVGNALLRGSMWSGRERTARQHDQC